MHDPQPSVLIFGGGHISKSLATVLDLAGFSVAVIDNREAFVNNERFPQATDVHAGEYEDVFPLLSVCASTYIAVVTRGHRDDMRVLRRAVNTADALRCVICSNMIGRKRKTIAVVEELEKEGWLLPRSKRYRRLWGWRLAQSPEEIAISVSAEMIAMHVESGNFSGGERCHIRRRLDQAWNEWPSAHPRGLCGSADQYALGVFFRNSDRAEDEL